MLSFEPVSVPERRRRWLDHHEHVLRSSVATIRRYRAATDHLVRFVENGRAVKSADGVALSTAEQFARYLRRIKTSPNGHPNTATRTLRDKGVLFILETCRAMFNYAAKHRHLPPYHENPFTQIELDAFPSRTPSPLNSLPPSKKPRSGRHVTAGSFPSS